MATQKGRLSHHTSLIMFTVGLTGGIGSGKTTVARIFEQLGVPVFYSDREARELTDNDPHIRQTLSTWYGKEIYTDQGLDRKLLASIIFQDEKERNRVNELIHPAVRRKFVQWASESKAPYVINEAAILFETGAYHTFDKNVLVTAPEPVRVQRVVDRDDANEKEVRSRISGQWPDEKKIPLADYIIDNGGEKMLIPQVLTIHEDIIRQSVKGSR